jgi:hypothetical protein
MKNNSTFNRKGCGEELTPMNWQCTIEMHGHCSMMLIGDIAESLLAYLVEHGGHCDSTVGIGHINS